MIKWIFFLLSLKYVLPIYKDSVFLLLHIYILKNSQISLLIIIRNLEIIISNVYCNLQRRFQSFIFCGLYYLLLQCYKIFFVCFVKFQINITVNIIFQTTVFPSPFTLMSQYLSLTLFHTSEQQLNELLSRIESKFLLLLYFCKKCFISFLDEETEYRVCIEQNCLRSQVFVGYLDHNKKGSRLFKDLIFFNIQIHYRI